MFECTTMPTNRHLALVFLSAALSLASCVKADPTLYYLAEDSGVPLCATGKCRCNGYGQCIDDFDGFTPPPWDANWTPSLDAGVADASTALDSGSPPDAAAIPDASPACLDDSQCPLCQTCFDGACTDQPTGSDYKNECTAGPCTTGNCDGHGACGFKPSTAPCHPSKGDCDPVEYCPGDSDVCPDDQLSPPGTECRAATLICDVPEKCTGSSADCPTDEFAAATKECRAAADACDAAENCTGSAPDCPLDEKQPSGHVCVSETCDLTVWAPDRTCDGQGLCSDKQLVPCTPYICGATHCKDTCASNAECSTGVCDLRTQKCALVSTEVQCAGDAGKLQTAIADDCDPGITCYLRVTGPGSCSNITVQDKDVYITGATIDPVGTSGTAGAAVYVLETTVQDTRLALANVTIQGAFGTSGHGILAEGTGNPSGRPELYLYGVTIGSSTAGKNNAVNGLMATNTDLTIDRTLIQHNGGTGLELSQSAFTIHNTIIGRNGLTTASPAVSIYSTTDGLTKTFRFNTVAGNNGGGITCAGTQGATTLFSSLFWNPGATENTGCVADASSDVPNSGANACANGDVTEPGFKTPTGVGADYRLTTTSACINGGTCVPEVTYDFEGEDRPLRGACDVGADEVP